MERACTQAGGKTRASRGRDGGLPPAALMRLHAGDRPRRRKAVRKHGACCPANHPLRTKDVTHRPCRGSQVQCLVPCSRSSPLHAHRTKLWQTLHVQWTRCRNTLSCAASRAPSRPGSTVPENRPLGEEAAWPPALLVPLSEFPPRCVLLDVSWGASATPPTTGGKMMLVPEAECDAPCRSCPLGAGSPGTQGGDPALLSALGWAPRFCGWFCLKQ